MSSVNGQQGAVVLDTDDISEGSSNLYYTTARWDLRLSQKTTDDLSQGFSNKYYSTALFDLDFAMKSTSDLSEGSNLYFTQSRFDSSFSGKSTSDLQEGFNLYYTQARFSSDFAAKSTDDLSEGFSNFYYSEGRFSASFALKDTDDLAEGARLYFTDARAKSAAVINSTAGNETDQAPSVSAVKSYVSSAVQAGVEFYKQKIILSAQDITNQYVNLAFLIKEASIVGFVYRLAIHKDEDFTLSTVSGVTRLTFAGNSAFGGNQAFVAGDALYFTYIKA